MDPELLAVLLSTQQETWHVEVDNLTIRLRATSAVPYATPDVAWTAARALFDAITALGHEPYGTCTIGVVSEYESRGSTATTVDFPITGWRGRVELWFATQPKA